MKITARQPLPVELLTSEYARRLPATEPPRPIGLARLEFETARAAAFLARIAAASQAITSRLPLP
jgi:hypothetical protein